MNHLTAFQEKFDTAIFPFLDLKIASARDMHAQAATLLSCIKEFMQTGGKRFRPALFYHAYESAGAHGQIDPLRCSFVFELFHTFALIHDDIIDNASLRRGKETINRKYGTATAILAGDLALMLADEIFMQVLISSVLSTAEKDTVRKLYDTYKQELITGQYLDYVHIPETSLIMLLKTSQYSFVRPAKFGFLFGSKRMGGGEKWDEILRRLGILFQIKDDYEGIFGNEKKIGKSVTSDIREGKETRVIELFRGQASPGELEKFSSFFGKNSANDADYSWFRNILEDKKINHALQDQVQAGVRTLRHEMAKETDHGSFYHLVLELAFLIDDFS